jgi:hypothetical protein
MRPHLRRDLFQFLVGLAPVAQPEPAVCGVQASLVAEVKRRRHPLRVCCFCAAFANRSPQPSGLAISHGRGRIRAAADVMQPRRTVLLALVLAVAAAAVVSLACWRRPAPVPVLSITVVGYTNVSITGADGHQYYCVCVGFRLTNEGVFDVTLDNWETTPLDPVPAVDNYEAPILLPPRYGNHTFFVEMEKGTSRWQFCGSIRGASVRERAFSRLFRTGWLRRAPVLYSALKLLPDKPGPEVEVKSGWFEVGGASNSPPQSQLLQPAGAAPGR